jgi:hypothetical protein
MPLVANLRVVNLHFMKQCAHTSPQLLKSRLERENHYGKRCALESQRLFLSYVTFAHFGARKAHGWVEKPE